MSVLRVTLSSAWGCRRWWFMVGTLLFCFPAETTCPKNNLRTTQFEAGLMLTHILPNKLSDFPFDLPVYGPLVGIPVGMNLSLQIGGNYGASSGFSLYTLETGMKWTLPVSFLALQLLGGGQMVHYVYAQKDKPTAEHDWFGIHAGAGATFELTRSAVALFQLKAYLLERTLFTLGGGFSFLL